MVFEYTGGCDLHEYLTMHSPQADFAKPPSSSSSHASTILEQVDFFRMGIQVKTSTGVARPGENCQSPFFVDISVESCGDSKIKYVNTALVASVMLSENGSAMYVLSESAYRFLIITVFPFSPKN